MIRNIWCDPLSCFTNATRQYGNIVYTHLGYHWFLISHPDHLKHVLQESNRNYRKGPNFKPLKSLTGEGLLASDGDYWLHQRRLVQPAFHHKRIDAMATTIVDCTSAMLQRWQPFIKHRRLDIEAEMHHLVIQIISRALFSANIGEQADVIAYAHTVCIEHITRRVQAFGFPPETWPTLGNRRFRKALQSLDNVVRGIIVERRRAGVDIDDLLSMLLSARDEATGKGLTDRQLRDELINILTAGFETTANALCWVWYLLSRHPHIMQKLQTEVTNFLGGRTPTAEDLAKLVYTQMVIKEVLRLYPPVWLSARTPLQNDKIGSYPIPAGAIILFSPYVTHHHPAIWHNPEEFDPERFTADRAVAQHRYAYIPFGGGPHLCIGHALATMMMQIIVGMVAQVYRLELTSEQPVIPQPLITLRPKHGLLMNIRAL